MVLESLLNVSFIMNVVLFVVGLLIGVGAAKALKGVLLMLIGLFILVLLGITVGSLFNLEGLLTLLGPLKGAFSSIGKLLSEYPSLSVGLIIGLVFGLIR